MKKEFQSKKYLNKLELLDTRFFEFYNIKTNIHYVDYKNLYNYSINSSLNKKDLIYFSLRSFYFFKLISFFKENFFNIEIILRLLYRDFINFWNLFLTCYKLDIYIQLLSFLIEKYSSLLDESFFEIVTFNSIIKPSTFFLGINLISNNVDWDYTLISFNKFLLKTSNLSYIDVFNKLKQQKFKKLFFELSENNLNFFSLHFLRVQRRYNKRRYSRVRAVSRSPFFAGITLSSIFVSSFWNSSIKSVDWFTSIIVILDIDFILFFILFYFLFRLFNIYNFSMFLRVRGKSRIVSYSNVLFIKKFILNFFK